MFSLFIRINARLTMMRASMASTTARGVAMWSPKQTKNKQNKKSKQANKHGDNKKIAGNTRQDCKGGKNNRSEKSKAYTAFTNIQQARCMCTRKIHRAPASIVSMLMWALAPSRSSCNAPAYSARTAASSMAPRKI